MVAGRSYVAQVYNGVRRRPLYAFLVDAVHRAGGRIVYQSNWTQAPLYLGVELPGTERLGLLVYAFTMTKVPTSGRHEDEVRGQIRIGGEDTWLPETNHPVAFDVAGVDVTLVLGIYLEGDLIVGLDPKLYDPLPMGISFYASSKRLDIASSSSWHAWERDNDSGKVRKEPRSRTARETLIAFKPERLMDFARLERYATDLGLDQSLRYTAAAEASSEQGKSQGQKPTQLHLLEEKFQLSGAEILEIISRRNRLEVAVKGGVAESHLERFLRNSPGVKKVLSLDKDGRPDFQVDLVDGRSVLIECKNASPNRYANGDFAVEVQKTRASKGDASARLYSPQQFDVVAACLFSATGEWTFRLRRAGDLPRHNTFPDKIRPMQAVDASWSVDLVDALGPLGVSS